MSIAIDRRQFIKLCGASVIAASGLSPIVVEAKNDACYEIAGFNGKQKRLIVLAVERAVSRLQEKRIWEKTYQQARWSYLSSDIMRRSNITDSKKARWNLLWYQLQCLSWANGPNDYEPAFPDIYIQAQYVESGGWVGRAPLNTVTVYWDPKGREWKQRGKFRITLNSAYVGSGGIYSSADYWAGTIAHEMLHNLGHQHGNLMSDKNYRDYQINVLDRIVASNGADDKGFYGSYSFGYSSASHACCGTNH